MRSNILLLTAALAVSVPAFADETVAVPQFCSAELRGEGMVTVVPGPVQRVTIVEGSSGSTHIWVDADRQLRIDTCNQQCPREYHLRVVIQSPQVPGLAVRGGGQITTAAGFAPQPDLAAAVTGGGRVDVRSVEATHVAAAVRGGGLLLVRARASLAAAVNGGGSIRYWGNPVVSSAIRGGGGVSPGS